MPLALSARASSESSPEKVKEVFTRFSGREICADVMFYDPRQILAIGVGENEFFDATGHFPILVGFDDSDNALYLSEVEQLETCVFDGSSSAVYTDELGKTTTYQKFDVMALRYDPSDLDAPGYEHLRYMNDDARFAEDAMDPTGPLRWHKLWPVEDPSVGRQITLYNYQCLRKYVEVIERHAMLAEDSENITPDKRTSHFSLQCRRPNL